MVRLALIVRPETAEGYSAVASRVADATFTVVVDPDPDRAARARIALGAATTARSVDELLARHANAIDAVLIHSSSALHAAHAQQVARAGKHVFVDSPLALTTDDADRVIGACRTAGVRLMVGATMRFAPAQQAIRQALAAGKLGVPGLLRMHRWQPRTAATQDQSPPDTSHSESTVVADVSGEVDLAIWYFNAQPTHVYAVGRRPPDAARLDFDYVQVHLGFSRGGMALMDVSAALPEGKGYFSLSMIGSNGAAHADDHHNTHLLYRGGDAAAPIAEQGTQATLALLLEFVAAIQQERPPAVDGADGRAAVRVAQAVGESLASGGVVRLDYCAVNPGLTG